MIKDHYNLELTYTGIQDLKVQINDIELVHRAPFIKFTAGWSEAPDNGVFCFLRGIPAKRLREQLIDRLAVKLSVGKSCLVRAKVIDGYIQICSLA